MDPTSTIIVSGAVSGFKDLWDTIGGPLLALFGGVLLFIFLISITSQSFREFFYKVFR